MKTKTPTVISAFVVAFLITFSLAPVQADTIALSFTSGIGSGNQQPHDLVDGWSFTTTTPITVTQLGLWDGPGGFPNSPNAIGDGFGIAHTVTLWTAAGVALTSATIGSGMSGTLTDGFRYVSLGSALLLAPGAYVITVYYPQLNFDLDFANAGTITTASGITYGTSLDLSGGPAMPAPFHGSRQVFDTTGTAFPTGDPSSAPKSYFGPNFQFNGAVVPDAGSTLLLLLLSVGPILLLRLRLLRS